MFFLMNSTGGRSVKKVNFNQTSKFLFLTIDTSNKSINISPFMFNSLRNEFYSGTLS